MTYRLNKKRVSKRTILFFGVVIVLVLLFLWGAVMPDFARHTLMSIASPVLKARIGATDDAQTLGALFTSKNKLIEENESLRFALREARLKLVSISAIKSEYEELLGLSEGEDRLIARVLSRPPVTLYDTFIINKGAEEGLEEGDLVLAGGNVAIGEIKSLQDEIAQVQLYSTSGVETDVMLGEEGVIVSALGIGGGNFVAHVPKEVVVSEGSTVKLASSVSVATVGIVGGIEEEQGNNIKTVLFRLPINPSTLHFVQIDS